MEETLRQGPSRVREREHSGEEDLNPLEGTQEAFLNLGLSLPRTLGGYLLLWTLFTHKDLPVATVTLRQGGRSGILNVFTFNVVRVCYMCTCGSQWLSFSSWFSPSPMWILGIKLRLLSLASGSLPSKLSHWPENMFSAWARGTATEHPRSQPCVQPLAYLHFKGPSSPVTLGAPWCSETAHGVCLRSVARPH